MGVTEMRTPPKSARPVLLGLDNVTEGYYELEELERRVALDAMGQHRELVAIGTKRSRCITMECAVRGSSGAPKGLAIA